MQAPTARFWKVVHPTIAEEQNDTNFLQFFCLIAQQSKQKQGLSGVEPIA